MYENVIKGLSWLIYNLRFKSVWNVCNTCCVLFQLIISITFTQAVKVHSLKIKAPKDKGPKTIKLFINQPRTLDFDMADSYQAIQELQYVFHNEWHFLESVFYLIMILSFHWVLRVKLCFLGCSPASI